MNKTGRLSRACSGLAWAAAGGAGALAIGCALAGPAMAQTPTVGPLVVVAQGSIFQHCTADHVGSQPGTNYLDTIIEPHLTINPANPKNFLVGVQQDRWSDGGARGLRGAYSFNGGKNFQITSTPGVTQCQGGPWPRASDPWVSFSLDGTAYFSELVTEELANPNLFGHNGQTVSQSVDGGMTWGRPITLIDTPRQPDPTQPQVLNDKNAVTADPVYSDDAYIVWDQLTSFTPGYGVNDEAGGNDSGHPDLPVAGHAGAGSMDVMSITRRLRNAARRGTPFGLSHTGLARAATANSGSAYPVYVTGPTYFSRTTDHGRTWEPARVIYDPGSNFQTIANQVAVLPSGTLLDFFTNQNDLSGADNIGWVRSFDRGKTWSPGYLALNLVNTDALTPNTQQDIRSADILFGLAVDRAYRPELGLPYGIIYLTWQDTRFTGQNEIALAFSADAGYSWYGPVRVNQTPRNPNNQLFQEALIPSVTVAGDGTVIVTYYDFRNDVPGATTDLTDYWAVFCNPLTSADACQSNSDWATEVRLTDTSFDMNNAPVAEGHFLGDYMGLKSIGRTAWPVFGVATAPNITEDLMRPIMLPSASAAAVAAR